MITVKRLSNIVRSRLKWLTRTKAKPLIETGLPAGLEFDSLAETVSKRWGERVKSSNYCHLSGWKNAGAFRLYLTTEKGGHRCLIYKNAIYSQQDIPALTNFPLNPGPPECLIYNKKNSSLNKFIPEVYLNEEIIPGLQYHYLLEDLGVSYRGVGSFAGRKALFKTVSELPKLYQALSNTCTESDRSMLLKYNQKFTLSLQGYVLNSLNNYSKKCSSEQVKQVLNLWQKIANIHSQEGVREMQPPSLIHGDCNPANVMIHKSNQADIKFLDWEWAGLGYPHADFVSLFPSADIETVTRVIKAYLTSINSLGIPNHLSVKEHHLLFEWCRLERGLNNASYVAAQVLGAPGETVGRPGWAVSFIDNSLNDVLRAYDKLSCA